MSDYKPDAYIKLGTDVFERWIEKILEGKPDKLKQVAETMQTMIELAKQIEKRKGSGSKIG